MVELERFFFLFLSSFIIKLVRYQRQELCKMSGTLEQWSQNKLSTIGRFKPSSKYAGSNSVYWWPSWCWWSWAISSPSLSSQQWDDCSIAWRLPPCIGIRIKNFNGLQVCCAIKTSYSHELSIHHCQANLQGQKTVAAEETRQSPAKFRLVSR